MAYKVRKEILDMCDAIDEQFVFEVGPFGEVVVEEVREAWLNSGNKVTVGHAIGYIKLLAEQIPGAQKQVSFSKRAMGCVKLRPAGNSGSISNAALTTKG